MVGVEPGALVAGKYRVERVIGRGGMGVVVAAVHVDLGQRVAIKVLLPEAMAHASTVARFEREARAVVGLESDHVARVFDVGRLDDGTPYMVMELLEGTDLAAESRERGRLPYAEAVGYVLQACDALGEAHRRGLVHRDVKPANLFLARRGRRDPIVKVLDFGISKLTSPEAAPDLTRTRDVMGSPLYMAPEQLRASKDVDARADVWSLGVTLYELVTGVAPFGGATLAELSANILTAEPPSVVGAAPASKIPAGLEQVVSRCLRKRPEDRYPDMDSLAAALAPFARAEREASSPLAATSDEIASEPEPAASPPPAPGRARGTPPLLPAHPSAAAYASTPSAVVEAQVHMIATIARAPGAERTRLAPAALGVAVILSAGVALYVAQGRASSSEVVAPPPSIASVSPLPFEPSAASSPPVASTSAPSGSAPTPPPPSLRPPPTAPVGAGSPTSSPPTVSSSNVARPPPPPPSSSTPSNPIKNLTLQ